MKNAWVKNVGIVIFIMSVTVNLQGQYRKQMLVPYHSQQTNKWCWAASMQMIIDFHENRAAITQSNLVKRLVKISNAGQDTSNTMPCCTECPQRNTGVNLPCLAGFEREFISSTNEVQLSALPDMFDLIFSSYGYSSTQRVNRSPRFMTWDEIKKEIEDCRPFIINIEPRTVPIINPNNVSIPISELGDHTIVVTGYKESLGARFIITNDPWHPCSSVKVESLFPYEVFTTVGFPYTPDGGTDYFVNRVLSMVYNIQPINIARLNDCKSCPALTALYGVPTSYMDVDPAEPPASASGGGNIVPMSQRFIDPPVDTSLLIDLLEQNAAKVAGFNQQVLTDGQYQELLQQGNNYYDAKILYVSLNKVKGTSFWSRLFPPCRLPKVLDEGYEIREMVSAAVDEKLVSTFQKAKGNVWVLRKITNQTPIRKNIELKFTGNKQDRPPVLLSNLKNKPGNAVNYQIVRTIPFYYEFYSFKLNPDDKDTYLSPVESYPGLSLKKGEVYKDVQIIKPIRKEIRLSNTSLSTQISSRKQLKTINLVSKNNQ